MGCRCTACAPRSGFKKTQRRLNRFAPSVMKWPPSPTNTAACSGANTARACAANMRRSSSVNSTPVAAHQSRLRPEQPAQPGKIATPAPTAPCSKIDEVSMRGEFDRQIAVNNWQGFSEAVYCATATAPVTTGPPTTPCAPAGKSAATECNPQRPRILNSRVAAPNGRRRRRPHGTARQTPSTG